MRQVKSVRSLTNSASHSGSPKRSIQLSWWAVPKLKPSTQLVKISAGVRPLTRGWSRGMDLSVSRVLGMVAPEWMVRAAVAARRGDCGLPDVAGVGRVCDGLGSAALALGGVGLQQGVDLGVLALPQITQPAVEDASELGILVVVALGEFWRNGHLVHAHDHARAAPAQEIPEAGHAIGVDDGGVDQRMKALAHGIERHGQRAGLGLEQVAVG